MKTQGSIKNPTCIWTCSSTQEGSQTIFSNPHQRLQTNITYHRIHVISRLQTYWDFLQLIVSLQFASQSKCHMQGEWKQFPELILSFTFSGFKEPGGEIPNYIEGWIVTTCTIHFQKCLSTPLTNGKERA